MTIPVPSVGAFEAPTVRLEINPRWSNIVSTALNDLLTRSEYGMDRNGIYAVNSVPVWDGDSDYADQQIQAIIAALLNGNLSDCPDCPEVIMIPVGTITPLLSDAIPAGWLKCDGSQYSEIDYPDLFSVLPAAFKSGTDFVVPNLTGRSLIGDGGAYALGDTGGEATHSLTLDEIPAHAHDVDAHNHSIPAHGHTTNPHTHTQSSHNHTISVRENSTGFAASSTTAVSNQVGTITTRNTSSETPTINSQTVTVNDAAATVTGSASPATAAQGGGGGHNNMPPYFVVNYIIKT